MSSTRGSCSSTTSPSRRTNSISRASRHTKAWRWPSGTAAPNSESSRFTSRRGESASTEELDLFEELGSDIGYVLHTLGLERTQERLRAELQGSLQQIQVIDRVLRHNLHNDMNVITGYAEMIIGEGDADTRRYAEQIRDTGNKLLRTVDKEREITRHLSERQPPEPLDIVTVTKSIVEDVGKRYSAAEVSLDHPPEAVGRAIPDIDLALEELLVNAIEHSDRDTPRIEVLLIREDGHVRLRVADEGPGIPEMERTVLTGGTDIDPLYHGSGLGLWLVNLIVRRSGGRLSFEDNDPRGSVVTITLPATVAE